MYISRAVLDKILCYLYLQCDWCTVLWITNRRSKKHVLLAGDFNADLVKYDNIAAYQDLIDIMSNHGFVQLESQIARQH